MLRRLLSAAGFIPQLKGTIMIPVPRFLTAALLLAVAANLSYALPRFASRTGSKCQSCHVNPSGGAMRQTFGSQYGREQLPVPAWSKDFEMEDFTNILTNVLGVGADFRTLFFYQQNAQSNTNAFWQMQGNIYLNFRVAKRVSMFISKGLYSGFEIFGLLDVLPAHGSVKVGKFVPNFGVKLDDHTVFTRTYTGFSPETSRPELTGMELAVSPGPLTVWAGVYNASDGFGAATGNRKAVLGRVEGMFPLSEHVNLGLGANVFANGALSNGVTARISGVSGVSSSAADITTTLWGGFGSLSIGDMTLFGEADMMKMKMGGSSPTALVSYVEADYVIVSGVDLKLGYDFFDPDKDHKTGSVSRYSVGLEFFPIPGVELRPVYRFVKDEPVDARNNELHVLVHFYL